MYTLWFSFGDIIVANLKRNIKEKYIYCEKCGVLFKQNSNKHKYCSKCAREIEVENHKKRNRKWWNNRKLDDLENPPNPHE